MIRVFTSCFFVFTLSFLVASPLTLEDFIKRGVSHSIELKKRQWVEKKFLYEGKEINAESYPSLDLEVSWGKSNFGQGGDTFALDREEYSIKLTQKLYEGGRRKSIFKQKKSLFYNEKYLSKDKKNEVAKNLAYLYFDTLFLQGEKKLLQEKREFFLRLLKDNPLVSSYLELVDFEQEKNDQKFTSFKKKLVSYAVGSKISLLEEASSLKRYLPISKEEAKKLMLLSHPYILGLKEQAKLLKEKRNELEAFYKPKISLEAIAHSGKNINQFIGREQDFSFLFKFSWNIFSGGKGALEQKKLEEEILFFSAYQREEKENLKRKVGKTWEAYTALKKQEKKLLKVIDSFHKSFEASKQVFLLEKYFDLRRSLLRIRINREKLVVEILYSMGYLADSLKL